LLTVDALWGWFGTTRKAGFGEVLECGRVMSQIQKKSLTESSDPGAL